jgi:hypothetical protein
MEVSFTDDLSGVRIVQVWFDHPSRDGVRLATGSGADPGWLVAGTNKSGTFRFTIDFPAFAATGDWVMSRLRATDYASNMINLSEQDIVQRGYPTKVTVTSQPVNQPPTANVGPDQTVPRRTNRDVTRLWDRSRGSNADAFMVSGTRP